MRYPVQIDAARIPVTVLVEGAALLIVLRDAAPRRLPVAAIDRVECRGEVIWHSAALRALALVGAPVVWRDGRGDPLLLALPPGVRARQLSARFEAAAQSPDWPDRVIDWLRAERAHALIDAARRLRQPLPDLRDRELAPAVAAFTAADPRFDGKAWVCRHLSTLYRVWMVSRLSALGLGWPLLGASGARPDAPRLMAAARGIDLAPVAVGLCRYLTRQADRHRSLAAAERRLTIWFEAEVPALERRRHAAWVRFETMAGDIADGADAWGG